MEQPWIEPAEPMKPPLPPWAYGVINPTMKFVLRSPLHQALSGQIMILIFDGRKSGKRYTIPVAYMEDAGKLYAFAHGTWNKNFTAEAAPVGVRVRGRLVRARARAIEDPTVIAHLIDRMVREQGETMAERMGVYGRGPDGTGRPQMPRGSKVIEVTPTGG